jgi:hypothetical protein
MWFFPNANKHLRQNLVLKKSGATFGNILKTPIFPAKTAAYKNQDVQNSKNVAGAIIMCHRARTSIHKCKKKSLQISPIGV